MAKRKKNIALVGLGYWGKNILRNLYELKVIDIACDSSKKVIFQKQKKYPSIRYTTKFRGLLNDRDIRAIVIASPAATHYELAKKAILAGKDVLVEKPLSLTVKEAKELIKLADKKKRVLMVGHILQYHPAVIKLKKVIKEGKLGKIQYIYSNRLNIGKLRTEENILWSFAPHDISVILSLVGERPKNIGAFGGDYLNRGVYDTTITTLSFANQIKAHIFVSWLHPYKEQRLIVVGSKAMAVFDDLTEEKLFIYPHSIKWVEGKAPIVHKARVRPVKIEKKEPLKEELKHFMFCVQKRKKPNTDGDEALRVLEILTAAEKKLKNG